MQRIQGLYYAPSPLSGRGVFTAEDIPKNTIIELAPIIEIPESEVDIIHHTDLHISRQSKTILQNLFCGS